MRLIITVAALLLVVRSSHAQGFDLNQMLCLVNQARAAGGVSYLGMHPDLVTSATQQSNNQAYMNTLTHYDQYGQSPATRIYGDGYVGITTAENVAEGATDTQSCMDLWIASPDHYANIMDPTQTHFGAAVATSTSGSPYYTQDFGGDGQQHDFDDNCDADSSSSSSSSATPSTSEQVTYVAASPSSSVLYYTS